MPEPLRYEISDWHQLTDVRSNNSRDLSIRVSDIIHSDILTGLRIRIEHKTFGTLFTYVVGASGSIISEPDSGITYELTKDQILAELARYGFLVTYPEQKHLPQTQLAFLRELLNLGYDKLRLLDVYEYANGVRKAKTYVVVFNIANNPNWLNNDYAATSTEFTKALVDGSVVNISASDKSHRWPWSWLDYVANIQDILDDNE